MYLQYWAGKCHHHSRLKQKDTTENVTKPLSTESMTHKAEVHEFLWGRHEGLFLGFGDISRELSKTTLRGRWRKEETTHRVGGGGGKGACVEIADRQTDMFIWRLVQEIVRRLQFQHVRKSASPKAPLENPQPKDSICKGSLLQVTLATTKKLKQQGGSLK